MLEDPYCVMAEVAAQCFLVLETEGLRFALAAVVDLYSSLVWQVVVVVVLDLDALEHSSLDEAKQVRGCLQIFLHLLAVEGHGMA